jgi:hypothetical protein
MRRLAPGGRVLIRMPTVTSHAYESYGTDWAQFDAPRHHVLFSRQGVLALCDRVDAEVVDVVDDSTAFQFWGSEQIRQGINLMDATSFKVDARSSPFNRRQLRTWAAEAVHLNLVGRGDQGAWIIRATG